MYQLAANGVLAIHVGFLFFALAGGWLLSRWPAVVWLHIPVVLYGVIIQIVGFRCILTDIEKWLLGLSGREPYSGECLPHYFWSHLGLTGSEPLIVVGFIAFILVVNAPAYRVWAKG